MGTVRAHLRRATLSSRLRKIKEGGWKKKSNVLDVLFLVIPCEEFFFPLGPRGYCGHAAHTAA